MSVVKGEVNLSFTVSMVVQSDTLTDDELRSAVEKWAVEEGGIHTLEIESGGVINQETVNREWYVST